jgi:mono/diheme cytochrome c family protein
MKPFLLLPLAAAACALSQADGAVDFDTEVRPILEDHCIDCHGEEKQKSGLRLDTALGLLRGGESGEALLVGGKSAESYLFKRVTTAVAKEAMPPKGKRLSAEQMAVLQRWIDEGATVPGADEARKELKVTTDHWSFQPVRRLEGDGIDGFVRAKLLENRLEASPEADRTTLIRRLFAVVHGMPPTPEQVAAFIGDPRPDAWERLVDGVLASPRFGERWARHWMDVARYADSNGFETNRERKTAYHYRDWLVASFNADKPYDRFVKEQLAGDRLGADAATGFLVAGPHDVVKSPDINLTLMQRQDELADMVNTTGTAFLGLTMGCARCHNHKFDPILQKDYYSMQAVFEGVNHGERPLREKVARGGEKVARGGEKELAAARSEQARLSAAWEDFRKQAAATGAAAPLRPPVNERFNEEVFAPVEAISIRFTVNATNAGKPCLDELEIFDPAGRNVALGGVATASGTLPGYAIHRLEHVNDGITGNPRSWISDMAGRGWVRIEFPSRVSIQRIVWSRARDGAFKDRVATAYRIEAETGDGSWKTVASSDDRQPYGGEGAANASVAKLPAADAKAARRVRAELAAVTKKIAALTAVPVGWAGTFSQPANTHRLYRGEPLQKREVVAPDVLSIIGTLGLAPDAPERERRLKFAEWVASPANPFTARVMVNRIWLYTYGSGIVDTPSDFGVNGARPTHPELLDWLADEFVRGGWSVKHVQRLMLLSAAFRQSSAPRANALAADAGGRFLWRYTPRRLEAEAIRDSMLAVSGTLDLTMGGPGFYLMDVVHENVMHYFPKEQFAPAEFRRMVYQFRIRQTTDSVFGSFDCPDGGSVTPKRSRSNTPLQALNLFNSGFTVQQAELLAARLVRECGEDPAAQVRRAFQLIYGRDPDAVEREASVAMIRDHGLISFSRAMFNTSEFLFIF